MNKYYSSSQEIDLVHLLLTLLSKWRIILLFIFIGAVLGAGFAYYKESTSYSNKTVNSTTVSSDKLGSMKEARDYYENYMLEKKWFDNSPFAKIGYNDGYTAISKYLITGDNSLAYASVYTALIRSQEFADYIYNRQEFEFPPEYLNEIINASINNYDQYYNTNVNNFAVNFENPKIDSGEEVSIEDMKNADDLKNSNSKASAFVTYVIRYDDKDFIQNLMNLLDMYLLEYYTQHICNNDYTLEKLDTFYELTPSVCGQDIKIHNSNINNATREYWKIVNSFDESEKQYFSTNYLNKDNWSLDDSDDSAAENHKLGLMIYVKYVVIGIILCGIIIVGIISCKYIFNGTIKNLNDLRIFNIPLYGIKPEYDKYHGNKVDKWLLSLLHTYSGLSLSPEYVSKSIQLQGLKGILIYNSSVASENCGLFKEKLWESVPKVVFSNYACSNDKESLIKAKELGNEIIIVELNKSKTKDLMTELNTAELQKINIAGIICI